MHTILVALVRAALSLSITPALASPLPDGGGPDQELGGFFESSISVNPLNASNVACASSGAQMGPAELRVSMDGGMTWGPPALAMADAGQTCCGDVVIDFDSQGRLFWSYLGAVRDGSGRITGIDIYMAQCDPTTGAILPGYPTNVTAAVGMAGQDGFINEKPWFACDRYVSSPFRDRIHLAWTEYPPGRTMVLSTTSSDQGMRWSAPLTHSTMNEGLVVPVQSTIAPNGDVFLAYHSQPGFDGETPDGVSGQVFLLRSTDGGASYPQKTRPFRRGRADMTFNVQTSSGAIPQTQFWTIGSVQPWVLVDPLRPGRVYVVAADDPDDDNTTADYANVYIRISDDSGQTWGSRRRIDSGPGTTLQIRPTAAIDPLTGFIVVHYVDNRNGLTNQDGNFLLDTFVTYSMDGGVTFAPDFQINDTPFDPDKTPRDRFPGPPPTKWVGEYNAAAIVAGKVHATWVGNTFDAGGSADGLQTIYDGFQVGPDLVFNGPAVAGATVNFTVYNAQPIGGLAQVFLSCTGINPGFSIPDNLVVPLTFDACTTISLRIASSLQGAIDSSGQANTPVLQIGSGLPPGITFHVAAFTWDPSTGQFVSVTPPVEVRTQ